MKPQAEWAAEKPDLEKLAKEPTMQTIKTADVHFPASNIQYAGSSVVANTVKSTEEVVKEMRTWLKTGIAPDGTRMMTDEASQWCK
ncbi:hypothetical protein, conserved [Eimeria brunetti]|uniref:Uncharacterized protein n=1 Tax=Eimeria brunetti TaxID=51314 RepID=U6LBZ8_9EIME|nr:hypothetical protein, conserved [Eimeria brunetti]